MLPTTAQVLRLERELASHVPETATQIWERYGQMARERALHAPAEAWVYLRAAELAFAGAELESKPGTVAGFWSEHSAGELGDYMAELDAQIRALDADVQSKPGPEVGQGFLGRWLAFIHGQQGVENVIGETGWFPYYATNGGWWKRFYSTEEIWKSTEAYNATFIRYYDEFVALGSSPTKPEPKFGPSSPPSKPVGWDDVRNVMTVAGFIGGAVAIGYLVRSFRGSGS